MRDYLPRVDVSNANLIKLVRDSNLADDEYFLSEIQRLQVGRCRERRREELLEPSLDAQMLAFFKVLLARFG
jgi:hypothetical protein